MIDTKLRRIFWFSLSVLSLALSVISLVALSYVAILYKSKPIKIKNIYHSPYVMITKSFRDGRSLYGSASFIRYKGKIFLSTAAHCVDVEHFKSQLGIDDDDNRFLLLDPKGNLIGEAVPAFIDRERDVAFAYTNLDIYEYVKSRGFFIPYKGNLEDLVGEECYYMGLCSVGPWFSSVPLSFMEKVCISRVVTTEIENLKGERSSNKSTVITVKGGGWFGCSGGPLVYKGEFILGVASHLEESPYRNPKTGVNYISILDSLIDFLGEEDKDACK